MFVALLSASFGESNNAAKMALSGEVAGAFDVSGDVFGGFDRSSDTMSINENAALAVLRRSLTDSFSVLSIGLYIGPFVTGRLAFDTSLGMMAVGTTYSTTSGTLVAISCNSPIR